VIADHRFNTCCCLVREHGEIRYDLATGKRLCHCADCGRPREEHLIQVPIWMAEW